MVKNKKSYSLIVIGASYGGIETLLKVLAGLSKVTNIPIVIVQHIKEDSRSAFAKILDAKCDYTVKEAEVDDVIQNKTAYVAPGGYHLLVEDAHTLSLSKDRPVEYSRPSIDVLFESAADAYRGDVIAIILTGANADGAHGVAYVHDQGGYCIAQDPDEAIMPIMPEAAIHTGKVDQVLNVEGIIQYVADLVSGVGRRDG